MNEINGYYEASIHPGQINVHYVPFARRSKPPFLVGEFDCPLPSVGGRPVQFQNNLHNGRISPAALKKISKAVSYLTYLVPKRRYFTTADAKRGSYFLTFVTLTLSSNQIHSDHEIKSRIMEPFLNEMRKVYKVNNYIWRAEKQENGNLHFHILADRFIWWNDLRNSWNYFQNRLGYVNRYRDNQKAWHREGFKFRPELAAKWDLKKQYSAYKAGLRTDWNSPNSTDIHSLRSISQVCAYVTKYITKPGEDQIVSGRLWGCSQDLSGLTGSIEFADGQISSEFDELMQQPDVRTYKSDYYSVVYYSDEILRRIHANEIINSLKKYLQQRFPDYLPPGLWDIPLAA
jgi:hypothetical protein